MSGMLEQIEARLDTFQSAQRKQLKKEKKVKNKPPEKLLSVTQVLKTLATPATLSLHTRLEEFARKHNMTKRQATVFFIERGFEAMGLPTEKPLSAKDISAYKLKEEVSKIAKGNVYIGFGDKDELIVYAPKAVLIGPGVLPKRCDGYHVRLERMGVQPPAGAI